MQSLEDTLRDRSSSIYSPEKRKEFMSTENKNLVNWIPVIELAVLAFTTLGTTITLYMYSDSKMESFRKESLDLHYSIRQEMKEMHQQWFQESKDFHARLCAIEERTRKE